MGSVAVFIFLLHTKPVRNLILRSVESYLNNRQSLTLTARSFDYNLLRMRFVLRDFSLTVKHAENLPAFLEAEEVSVRIPINIFFKKGIHLSSLKFRRPHLYYFIDDSGQRNTPISSQPKAFRLDQILPNFRLKKVDIEDAQIHYIDESHQTDMELAGVRLAMRWIEGAGHSFQIHADRGGHVQYKAIHHDLNTLSVQGEIDESHVDFKKIHLDVSESRLEFSGKLSDFTRPSFTGSLGGVLDLADVRWILPDEWTLSGRLNIESEIEGPLDELTVRMNLEGKSLSFKDLEDVTLTTEAIWEDNLLSLSHFNFSTANGRLEGKASLHPLDWERGNRVELSWESVDLDSLGFISEYLSMFSSKASGSLQAFWSAFRLDAVEGQAEMHVFPQEAMKLSTEKIPLAGRFQGDVQGGRIVLSVEELIVSGAQGEGSFQIEQDSLQGEWKVESQELKTSLSSLSRLLNTTDQKNVFSFDVDGSLHISGDVEGTLRSPVLRSQFAGEKISYRDVNGLTVEGKLVYRPSFIEIESTLTHPDIGQVALAGFYPLASSGAMDFRVSGERLVLEKILSLSGQKFPAAASINFEASVTGEPEEPQVKSEWLFEDLSLYGETFEKVNLSVVYMNERITLESLVASKHEGAVKASGWFDFRRKEYATRFSVESLRMEGLQLSGDSPKLKAVVDLSGESTGTLQSPQIFAEGVLSDCSYGDSEIGDMQVRAHVIERRLEFSIAIPNFQSRADGSLLLNTPFKLAATVDVEDLRLERMNDLFPLSLEKNWSGEFRARFEMAVDLAHPADTWDVQARIDRFFLDSGPLQIQSTRPVVFRADTNSLKIEDLQIKGNGMELEGKGYLAWKDGGHSDLSVKVDADLTLLSGFFQNFSAEGQLNINSHLYGSFRHSELTADSTLSNGRFELTGFPEVFDDIRFRIQAKNNMIDIRSCVFKLRDMEFSLVGKLPFLSLPVSLPIMSGTQEVEQLDLQLSVSNLRDTSLKDGHVESNNRVQIRGSADLIDSKSLELDVKGDLDFRLIQAFIKNVQTFGKCEFDFRITGRPDVPHFSGSAGIHGAGMTVSAPRFFLENLEGRVQFEDSRIILKDVQGLLNGGSVEGTGGIGLDGWKLSGGEIALKTENVLLDISRSLRTQISSDLKFKLSKEEKVLSGTILVLHGQYTEPIDFESSFFRTLRRGASSKSAVKEPSQWFENLRWQVNVTTLNPFIIDNNLLRSQLTAATSLTGTFRQSGLTGRLESLEGGKLFFGKNTFLIQQATVDFINPRRIEPDLNVTAVTEVGEYDIKLTLTGTPEEMSAGLTSDPPLTEPNIIALLVTGTTLEGASSSLLSAAGSEAMTYLDSALTGKLENALEKSLGLESVRIDAGLISSIDNPGARITLQQHLSRNLELILSQNLQAARNRLWVLDYNPLPSVNIQGIKEDNNEMNVSFRHELRFGLKEAEKPPEVRKRPVIDKVLLEGSPLFSDRKIKNRLHLRSGSRFDYFKLYDGLDRLRELYFQHRFLNFSIVPARTEEAGKMQITLRIEAGPKVNLEFQGAPVPRKIKVLAARLWMITPIDRLAIESIEERLKEHFIDKRHYQVAIRHDASADREEDKRIVFKISQGLKYKKPEFHFEGNRYVPDGKLEEIARRRPDPYLLFTNPRVFIRRLRDFYTQNGFLQARLDEPQIHFFPRERKTAVTFSVQEGPQYRIGRVAFEGNLFFDRTVLEEKIGIRENDLFRQNVIEEAVFIIEETYARKGFNKVKLDVLTDVDDKNGIINLSFELQENQQGTVGEIRITGNSITSEKIISREIELKKGDPVDFRLLNKARKRLYDLGIFKRVQIDAVPLENGLLLNDQTDSLSYSRPYRIEVKVVELQPYRLRYGLQYDTETSLGVSTELVNRNLLGRSMLAGASFRWNREERDIKGFYRSPYFLSEKISTEFFIYFNSSEKPAFSLDRGGLTIQQQTKLGQFSILSYSYSFEKVRTFYNDLPPDWDTADSLHHVGMLNVAVSRDTRDNLLNASRGLFFSQNLGYAAGWLGSDVRFIRYFGELYTYKKISDSFVYAFAFRMGLGKGLGQEFSLSQRFFAGGGTTIRGFRKYEVGPKNPTSGLAQGGDAVLIMNHELRFPVYKKWSGAVFLDMGNVYGRLLDFNPFDLREAAGFGLRFQAGFLLIRVDWGFKLDRRPGEPLSSIFFSIGQVF